MIRRCILPAIAALVLMAVPAQAAQTPTTAATPAASAAATPSSPAADALPVLLQVPDGLVQVDDQTLSLDDTVLGFEDQEEAREKLQEWGWETTLSRSFAVPPDETANPTEIVAETLQVTISERGATRMDDRTSDASMERRKKEGYF